jgi:hypothetical protein
MHMWCTELSLFFCASHCPNVICCVLLMGIGFEILMCHLPDGEEVAKGSFVLLKTTVFAGRIS